MVDPGASLPYPRRPVRALLITFAGLATFVGAFVPFVEEVRDHRPFAIVYCACLAVAAIGWVRFGVVRSVIFVGIPTAMTSLASASVIWLMDHPDTTLAELETWIRVLRVIFYGWVFWCACIVLRGWHLYYTDFQAHRRHDAQQPQSNA